MPILLFLMIFCMFFPKKYPISFSLNGQICNKKLKNKKVEENLSNFSKSEKKEILRISNDIRTVLNEINRNAEQFQILEDKEKIYQNMNG